MYRIILIRLATTPLVLLGVSLALFVATNILPSDPVRMIIGDTAVSPEVRAAIEARYGLDQPLYVQYFNYVRRLLAGDLGTSLRYNLPVLDLLWAAFPATLVLGAAGSLVTLVLALPLGFLAAKYRDSTIDVTIRFLAVVGLSTPAFFLGIVMIIIFGFHLGWFPISGRGRPPDIWHIVLPALVLGLRDVGSSVRVLRASLIDEMQEDYVRAARSRGLGEQRILYKHIGRNSLVPTMTDMGVNFANLAGQVILIESVFAYHGVGRLLQIGIQWNDYPLVIGTVMLLLLWVVLINLIVDLLHYLIDPRIRT